MRRWLVPWCFVLLSAAAPAAEETEQLDAEFLEYLATMEGDDDDWTLVAEAEEAQAKLRKDAKNRKPSKEVAPAAADKR